MMRKIVFFIFISFLFQFKLSANRDFQWEPITEADWAVSEDSSKGIRNAVMIFEKIISDDRNLMDEKCYYEIYRRIRILNSEGRKWGDVIVPYLNKKQKVEKIYGRTILPDNRQILLDQSQIFEKEVFKASGIKIKQKSFSMPAVSNNCIIEYYIKYRVPSIPNLWLIQKDIYLMKGKFVWKFYRGRNLYLSFDWIFAGIRTPNYLWLNTKDHIKKVEQIPSIKDPKQVVFTIQDVEAFESESYSLPDIALKTQLRCYYGGTDTPAAYWGNLSKFILKTLDFFTQKNKRVRNVIESFSGLTSKEEKIKAAYTWLQENIKNTTYEDSEENYKKNKNVDEIIKHGYGTEEDINRIFYDMLREMNIDAKMAFVYDRDDNFFVYDAKYWQFNHSLIAVPNDTGNYDFYNPGGKYLPMGTIAWFNEGILAFVIGEMRRQFLLIPFSTSRSNRINRYQVLTMDENFQLKGRMIEKHKGHSARSLRLRFERLNDNEKMNYLQEKFSESFPNSEVDSFSVEGLEDINHIVNISCNIKFGSAGQHIGNHILLKPYDLFSKYENPFQSDKRNYLIIFDYAKEVIEVLQIELPASWTIEAMPSDSIFSNIAGVCQINFKSYSDGKVLSIQRCFMLDQPAWKPEGYNLVKELFQTEQAFEEMTVILKKK